jgi:DNA-directed RNA polymerase specialized sigma24 family protein
MNDVTRILAAIERGDLNDALDGLAAEDPQAAQFVKLRYFTGLSVEEAAEMVGLSRSAACEHWAYARAWLHRRLKADDGPAGGWRFFPFSAGWISGRWRMEG